MPKVLHIGPCDTPGGMANVMQILAGHPPEGWEAELLSSHVTGSPWAKWRAYRKARNTLVQMLKDPARRPDVVHLHTAADWSWWRKRRFAVIAHGAGSKVVVHIHSGKFDRYIGNAQSRRSKVIRKLFSKQNIYSVVLSESWKEKLQPLIGPTQAINNPVDPSIKRGTRERDANHLLLLGRNDPVKGHSFAREVVAQLRASIPSIKLTLTGLATASEQWVDAKGWIDDDAKYELLHRASVLIVPSAYEGQPLVILEALASGLQVCASNKLEEIIPTVRNVPFEDVESWVIALRHMLEHPIAVEEMLLATKPYELETVSKKWRRIYNS